ncbi:MAG TPA: ClpX C4-type zinc finger protein [Anaeromyxobacteraceae bacterium]|nr:ClpX C4-type zinc finger protein [Anaeromyxobacteraceae bacterium]
MVMDEELLKKAHAAGSRLTEAERQAQLARAEYHTAVRRLHLAGGSLREIAQALAMSHQRVQQIVSVAGGTWWQRVWRTRNVKRDTVCTFCNRPPSEVSKLIAGPDVYICDACVVHAERTLGGAARSGTLAADRRKTRCSFCGKRSTTERRLATGATASVCGECLRLCRQILDDRTG